MATKQKSTSINAATILLFAFLFLFPFGQLTQIPFIPVRVYLQDVILCLMWMYLVVKYRNLNEIKKSPIFLPASIFIIIAFVSLLFSTTRFPIQDVLMSSLYLVRWIGYSGIALIVWLEVRKNDTRKNQIQKGLIVAGTLASALGLIQYVVYPDLRNLYYLGWDPHYLRVFGTFFDPNFLGLIITLTLIALVTTEGLTRKTKIALWVINSIALALTYSRSSYIAFLISFIVLLLIQKKKKMTAIVVLLVLGIILLLPRSGQSEGVKLERLSSISSRIESMHEGMNIFSTSPIIGVGFNTLKQYKSYNIQVFKGKEIPNNSSGGIENSFMFLLATTGITGLIVYLWLMRRMYKTGESVLKISLIAIMVHSLFNNSLFYPWVMAWIWIMVGTSLFSQPSSHSRHRQ